jgi:hypothetical protein
VSVALLSPSVNWIVSSPLPTSLMKAELMETRSPGLSISPSETLFVHIALLVALSERASTLSCWLQSIRTVFVAICSR